MSATATARPRDPAEKWEIPLEETAGPTSDRGIYEVFPRTPRRLEDVPPEAWATLTENCRIASLGQVFILPRAVRFTGSGERRVVAPASVLGLGTAAVGLWTEEPTPGLKLVIPLDRLAGIEDVTTLLYGRLSFTSFGSTLTIRYNTLARRSLKPALLELRERLIGAPRKLPTGEQDPGLLPLKWRRLLRTPYVRFREDAPVAYRFAVEPGKPDDEVERGQLLVVNPHELVYLCDPPEASHNYGEDSVIVPRPRITRVRVRERYLEVTSNGARLCLGMSPALRTIAAQWLV